MGLARCGTGQKPVSDGSYETRVVPRILERLSMSAWNGIEIVRRPWSEGTREGRRIEGRETKGLGEGSEGWVWLPLNT